MSEKNGTELRRRRVKVGCRLRVATILFPPLGLVLLWSTAQGLGRKILGTAGVLLYSLLYAAAVIWLLIRFDGLRIEWRGGYVPALTFHQTIPNYEALERHLAQQRAASAAVSRASTSSYWTGFRGPNRDGRYDEQAIFTNWPLTGLRLLWRQPCGGGYASFAVAEGAAFTIEQRRDKEVVVAYDVETGRELWTNGWNAFFSESMGGDGPRATPTYDQGKVYALGAEGELRCLQSADGAKVWSKNILGDNHTGNVTYGMSGSPLIVDEKVIVQPGGSQGNSMAAYHKLTGEPIWRTLSDGAAYSSPMLVSLAGQRQVLVVTATRAAGLAVKDGKLLWEQPWVVQMNNRNIAQPVVVSSNRFFLSAGYGTGCEVVEVTPSDTGFSTRVVWRNKLLKNKFTSSVLDQGYLYGLDEDMLTCVEAATGKRRWKDGHYGYGQLLLASGHLIILSGEGELAFVRATPEKLDELSRFPAIHGKTWNHPAIADGKLLVRNAVEMACFEISRPIGGFNSRQSGYGDLSR